MPQARSLLFSRILAVLLLFSTLGIVVYHVRGRFSRSAAQQQAAWHFHRENWATAIRLNDEQLLARPDNPQALLLHAELSAQIKKDSHSIAAFQTLTESSEPAIRQQAYQGLGDRYFQLGQLALAEQYLRKAIEMNPRDLAANKQLGHILYAEGRTWEALPFIEERVRQGHFIADELSMLASTESWILEDTNYADLHPDECLLELGSARIALLQNRHDEALGHLESVLQKHSTLAEAQAARGLALVQLNRIDEAVLWRDSLPEEAKAHPEIWRCCAEIARAENDSAQVVHCLTNVLELHPYHGVATYQLAQELSQLDESDLADTFFERAKKITEVHTLAGELRGIYDIEMAHNLCKLLLELDRPLEAAGWADMIRRFSPELEWPQEITKLAVRQGMQTAKTVPFLDEVASLKFVPMRRDVPAVRPSAISNTPEAAIRFEERSNELGIQFSYDIGKDIDSGMEHIFETTGGGAGVLDYDQDGWADLYLAQAKNWKNVSSKGVQPDALYRNRGGEDFANVAELAGISELGFSQGVTTGDLNEDGFPDIYVCNLGENSCFINNGDGTFTEVALDWNISSDLWSLSAAIADVNGDQLADLYVVNYLNKEEVAERACKHEGQPRSCAPTMFSGAQDCLFLSDGQGGFREVAGESGITQNDGKGLGILVADFFNNGSPELYVGNDTVANFFFVRTNPESGDSIPTFQNEAVARGLAYNSQGQVQATMGMAIADLNHDNLLDIFSTNFYHDANTLYIQSSSHFFEEQTRNTNLYDAGFLMLGFGTQFIDADLDGEQDIVITNGHVDRMFATGEPDFMRPQFFHNLGGGTFEEVPEGEPGSYFSEKMLGRGLAIIDQNNDGRQDFVVTHLDRPAALLVNQTETDNHFLTLRLIGRSASRVPIGSRVELKLANGNVIRRQLTAGDGYEVRNDSRLFIGLGANDQVEELSITWPNGATEQFSATAVDTEFHAVEGIGRLLRR